MMSRLLALLALVGAMLVGTSTAAYACSCSNLTPARAVANANTVFTGTVTEVRGSAAGPLSPNVYTFRADNVYKGAPDTEVTLASNTDTAACGYPFERDTRYLVFATSAESGGVERVQDVSLISTLCSGNVPLDPGTGPLKPGDERGTDHESLAGPVDAELIAALGTPAKSTGPAESDSPAATVARPSAAGATGSSGVGWGPLAGGAAVIVLLLAVALALAARRRARP